MLWLNLADADRSEIDQSNDNKKVRSNLMCIFEKQASFGGLLFYCLKWQFGQLIEEMRNHSRL